MRKRREERQEQYESKTYRALQKRIARNIRKVRHENEWTQERAAHYSNLSVRLLQRIEAAEVNLTLTTLARIVEGFGVEAGDLFQKLR